MECHLQIVHKRMHQQHHAVQGSGARIQADFGLPNLVQFPIHEDLSAAGDGGEPLVVSQPTSQVSQCYSQLAAAVVQEVAKLSAQHKSSVDYDSAVGALRVRMPARPDVQQQGDEFLLEPAMVRRNDTSARSVNEWTGERIDPGAGVPDDIEPNEIAPLGNYAVQISWEDGFNQVAPFELLASLPRVGDAVAAQQQLDRVAVPSAEPVLADV